MVLSSSHRIQTDNRSKRLLQIDFEQNIGWFCLFQLDFEQSIGAKGFMGKEKAERLLFQGLGEGAAGSLGFLLLGL